MEDKTTEIDPILTDARDRYDRGHVLAYVHVLALARESVRTTGVASVAERLGISRTAVYRAIRGTGELADVLVRITGANLIKYEHWIAADAPVGPFAAITQGG